MLQRSPSYVLSRPGRDRLATVLERLPARLSLPGGPLGQHPAHRRLLPGRPGAARSCVKGIVRKGVEAQLPDGVDVDVHFKPRYDPWDQRLCFVPDGDLFRALRTRAGLDRHRHHRDVHAEPASGSPRARSSRPT